MDSTEVVVLCPTRGRPGRAAAMMRSAYETMSLLATQVVLVVDDDDPELDAYLALPDQFSGRAFGHPLRPPDRPQVIVLKGGETGNLVAATNSAAKRMWDDDVIFAHVGDDHLFRSKDWDRQVVVEIGTRPGIVAPDDGMHGGRIPTACFIHAAIPRTLGWLALPGANHLYIDDAWRKIGEGIGRYIVRLDIKVIHEHPATGRVAWDEGYRKANSSETWEHDRVAFEEWLEVDYDRDIAKVREAIDGSPHGAVSQ